MRPSSSEKNIEASPSRTAAPLRVAVVAVVAALLAFLIFDAKSRMVSAAGHSAPNDDPVAGERSPARRVLSTTSADGADGGAEPLDRVSLRATRDAMRQRIWHALAQPAPVGSASRALEAPPPLTDPPGPEGHATAADEDALGEMHGRWKALAQDCYAHALARTPALRGRLEFHSVIVGDPSVGGIVESAELADGGTIDDAELLGCLRESVLTLAFPAPRGGSWYRFDFPAKLGEDGGIAGE